MIKCHVCKEEKSDYILNTCIDCLEKDRLNELEMKRCPLDPISKEYDYFGSCNKIGDNKDSQILFKHLMEDHTKEQLAQFIKEGVEDHWD